jgi:hypothetical protein
LALASRVLTMEAADGAVTTEFHERRTFD